MTQPQTAPPRLAPDGMLATYQRLKSTFAWRHRMAETIHQVRKGNLRQLFPEELEFSLSFEGVPIANFVDTVARDMAEGLAPLPALACVSGKMETQADQQRAELKNRIGDHYWQQSRLAIQMLRGADQFVSYGFLPVFVEPNTDRSVPFIHIEDPRHAVYQLDRFGNCVVYANRWRKSVDDLCALYPHLSGAIRSDPKQPNRQADGNVELEMVRWVDRHGVVLFLPERAGLVLDRYDHKMTRTPAWIAERPGDTDTPRGQFDDIIWVQVARAIMSTLALEAAYNAVQAPLAIPSDMDEIPLGPHALLQTDTPDKIHRVALDLPPQIFAEEQILDQEMRVGSRYPDARSGNTGASVITGKGVEALLGGFDSQIKGGQIVLKEMLEQVTSMCFEMDEAWWPDESKVVSGTLSGTSYEFTYRPSKDIGKRCACTVTYGFAAGMAPSQSIITLLQLEGAGLIAKGTTQANLPFSLDSVQEQRKIDVEGWREALKQGMFAYLQSAGQVVAQGGDPTETFSLAVDVIHRLQNGAPVEDAVNAAYQVLEQQKQQQAAQAQAQAAAAGQQPDDGTGGPPDGGQQVQAGPPGGGRPTLEQMIAGFRGAGNVPVLQDQIRRSVPTGVQ